MRAQALFVVFAAVVAVSFAENPYGACAHVTRGEPALRTCSMMRQAGMGWVRSDFDWASIEREKGKWDFTPFDRVLLETEGAGVRLLPILGYSVPWAHPAHEHLDEWGEYVRRVVTRYGQRLPVLEVWNEQNGNGFWENPNPTNYLKVLRRTREVARSIEPKVRIAFGGTSGVPFEFIEEVYRLGGANCFDIMNVHPYSHPDQPEGRMDEQLERLRDMMAKYGDAQKPIWITEVGWPTHQVRVVDGEVLRAGLRALDPAKRNWRALYVPTEEDTVQAACVAREFPSGTVFEVCTGRDLAGRLATGNVDVVVFPFTEEYDVEAVGPVYEFVKKGGILIDFGGMPMWYAKVRDGAGRMRPDHTARSWDARRLLRIAETAWWNDKRYPKEIAVQPAPAAKGLRPPPQGFKGERFITPSLLKPGDELIPLLSARTNGVEAVCAGIYKFNSDMKGAVLVSCLFNRILGTSDEARQAKMTARALGIAFAERIEAFFLYEFRQPDQNPYDPESYFGIVRDNFAPKPAYGAYMTFIDRRPPNSVQKDGIWRSADGLVYFPQWTRPEKRPAGMIWTVGAPGPMTLEFTSANVSFLDVNGARVRPARAGNTVTLEVGDAPIYFTGAELKTQAFHTGLVAVAKGDTPQEYLETVRRVAGVARATDPRAVVGGGGVYATDDFAKAFIGLGESEEIDFWQVAEPTPARVKLLRGLFDGAGGKAVRLVDAVGKPLDAPVKRASARLEGKLSAPLLVAGTGRAYILEPDGKVSWQRTGCGNIHRVQRHGGYVYYSNGDLYRCRLPGTQAELVYRPKTRAGAGVLGFEVLPNGNVVMAVNSTDEVIELEARTGRELVRFKVNPKNAKGGTPGAHGHLRMVRKTAKGTYLVCCAGAACVREYTADGKLVWEQAVPVLAFDCIRRANGNTLVSHLTGVTEYAPDHRAVWSFVCGDLPNLRLANLCGIQETKAGNLVVGTWANGEPDATRATAFEITREKKLVWAWYPNADRNMMTAVR
ncbi:MAG: hypothetical protein ACI4RA_07645 [Kiritimatiellia bacterium]